MVELATDRKRNWAGLAVPAILLLGLLADGLSRFLSLDPFTIRAWEAMTRNAFTEGGIPLEPSKHYENDHSFGDLAAATNRPEMRRYHREAFTSDAFGYRNQGDFGPNHPADAILVGTSFSIGSGVSDDQTLAVGLGKRTGLHVYNAAGGTPSPERIVSVAGRLGLARGTVFYEILEANHFPTRPAPMSGARRLCFEKLGRGCLRLKGWALVSPVGVESRRAYHWLEDDRWLPNTPARSSIVRSVDGAPMLFGEEGTTTCPEITDEAARDYFRWFRDGLGGLDLYVLLVPSKFTVYGGLADPGGAAAASDETAGAARCFDTIERALRELGIRHLDLSPLLQRAAREALPRHQLLYFRDDTHWNAAGIEAAASIVGDALGPANHPR